MDVKELQFHNLPFSVFLSKKRVKLCRTVKDICYFVKKTFKAQHSRGSHLFLWTLLLYGWYTDTRQWIEIIAATLESTCCLVGAASVCFQEVILLHWLVQRFALHLATFSHRYVHVFNRAACMLVVISFLVKNFRLCHYCGIWWKNWTLRIVLLRR